MSYRAIFAILLVLSFSTVATAGVKGESFYFSTMLGSHVFEGDQHLDNALFWSLGLGYNLTEQAALEAVFSQTKADGETSTDRGACVQTLRIDALLHFQPNHQLVPYLVTGLGQITNDPDSGSSTRHFMINLGGGLKYFINDHVALAADLRYLLDFDQPDNNLLGSAGLIFQFGRSGPSTGVDIGTPSSSGVSFRQGQ